MLRNIHEQQGCYVTSMSKNERLKKSAIVPSLFVKILSKTFSLSTFVVSILSVCQVVNLTGGALSFV